MGRIKKIIRSFFGFSHREANAFLILLPLLILFVIAEPLYEKWRREQPVSYVQEMQTLDSAVARLQALHKQADSARISHEKLPFNPNTCSQETLMSYGLPAWLGARIINYRQSVRPFFSKKDLLKVYGMDSERYARIARYIMLPEDFEPSQAKKSFSTEQKPRISSHTTPPSVADINMCDSLALVRVRGIGPALSQRILKFRNRLGGFHSMNQLYEVYGLDSATVKEACAKFSVLDTSRVKTISLNQADEKTLSAHPYIGYKTAKLIVAYRRQHGRFKSVEDLGAIIGISPQKIKQLQHYLHVDK